MGQCYWHGSEVYPGHPCSECEKKNESSNDVFERYMYERAKKEQKEWTEFLRKNRKEN